MFKNIPFYKKKTKRKKVGVALGSGSSRGWAHIGVLDALDKNGIKVDYIAGTSIGSFVGAIYAAGELKSLKNFASKMRRKDVLNNLDFTFPRYGFLTTDKVSNMFNMHTNIKQFSELNIPLKVVATNLLTGEQVIIGSGNIIEAVSASGSVPGIVVPYVRNKEILVDGGLVNPVPVDIVRDMGADIVIAIDLSKDIIDHRFKKQKKRSKENIDQKLYSEIYFKNIENPIVQKLTKHLTKAEKVVFEKVGSWKKTKIELPNIFETFSTSIDIMETQIAKANFQISKPDVIIHPKLANLNFFDFNLGKKAIDEGYKRTMEKMEEIKSLIDQ